MPKTLFVIEGLAPHASVARSSDFLTDIRAVFNKHKVGDFFVTQSGPFSDNFTRRGEYATHSDASAGSGRGGDGGGGGDGRGRLERGPQSEAGKRAAEDFAEPEADAGAEGGGTGTGKRRGRPPGSGKRGGAAEAGSGASAGQRDGRGEAGGGAEGARGSQPVGTRQGADEGAGEGAGRNGGADGGGRDQRGDRQAARVSSGEDRGEEGDDWNEGGETATDDEWNDAAPAKDDQPPEYWAARSAGSAWPDELMPPGKIDASVLAELLADHFNATGGKDRGLTFAVMEEATGERAVKNVKAEDYDKLARALLKDAARYRYGVKEAK